MIIDEDKIEENGTKNINDEALLEPSFIVVWKYAVVPKPKAIEEISKKLIQNLGSKEKIL